MMFREVEYWLCGILLLASEFVVIVYLSLTNEERPLTRLGVFRLLACRSIAWVLVVYFPFAMAWGYLAASWNKDGWGIFRWHLFYQSVVFGLPLPVGLGLLLAYLRMPENNQTMTPHQPIPHQPALLDRAGERLLGDPNETGVTVQPQLGVSKSLSEFHSRRPHPEE